MPASQRKQSAMQDKNGDFEPEYDIYIFRYPMNQAANQPWEKKLTTRCPKHAQEEAMELHLSRAYPKIEIKKRWFDLEKDCKTDCTLKVYEAPSPVQKKTLWQKLKAVIGL